MALEEHSTSRASAYLDVKLGESHEQTVSQADQQPAGIQPADVRRGHHDEVGAAAEEAGRPDGSPPPEDGGDGTGAARALVCFVCLLGCFLLLAVWCVVSVA